MDPDACVRRIIEASDDGDLSEVEDAIADLKDWILRGGVCTEY